MNDRQMIKNLQGNRLMLLKMHALYMKVENVLTFPFRWVAEKYTNTDMLRYELKRQPWPPERKTSKFSNF